MGRKVPQCVPQVIATMHLYTILSVAVLLVDIYGAERNKWTDEDGVEVEIVKGIPEGQCLQKSEPGDTVEQYYRLTDGNGKLIGSNFGEKPFKFTLGSGEVIRGMETAMRDMCEGERRRVIIPPGEAFDVEGREADGILPHSTLHYLIELKKIHRQNPGERWLDDDGLQIRELHKIDDHNCKRASHGDLLSVYYTLFLEDGTFVSSVNSGEPFQFVLGFKQVVPGLDRALNGMCEGEKRKIDIPPKLAYGEEGNPPMIPGDVYLNYHIELLKVTKKEEL